MPIDQRAHMRRVSTGANEEKKSRLRSFLESVLLKKQMEEGNLVAKSEHFKEESAGGIITRVGDRMIIEAYGEKSALLELIAKYSGRDIKISQVMGPQGYDVFEIIDGRPVKMTTIEVVTPTINLDKMEKAKRVLGKNLFNKLKDNLFFVKFQVSTTE